MYIPVGDVIWCTGNEVGTQAITNHLAFKKLSMNFFFYFLLLILEAEAETELFSMNFKTAAFSGLL